MKLVYFLRLNLIYIMYYYLISMTKCNHSFIPSKMGVWLPSLEHAHSSLQIYQYCSKCGLIKINEEGQGKKVGFFMNIIGRIDEKKRIPTVQKRLLAKELLKNDLFTDPQGSYFSFQVLYFLKLIHE